MKNILAVILGLAIIVCFTGCGQTSVSTNDNISSLAENSSSTTTPNIVSTTTPSATPTTTPSQKNTAYTNALTWVYAENDTDIYGFVFEKGVLVTVYVEDDNGKYAFGKDTYQGLENSPFKGMIVEEIVDKFEKDGYTVTINK